MLLSLVILMSIIFFKPKQVKTQFIQEVKQYKEECQIHIHMLYNNSGLLSQPFGFKQNNKVRYSVYSFSSTKYDYSRNICDQLLTIQVVKKLSHISSRDVISKLQFRQDENSSYVINLLYSHYIHHVYSNVGTFRSLFSHR